MNLFIYTSNSRVRQCHIQSHFADVQPIANGVSFLHSYGITFIWDHIHMGSHSYRRTAYCIWSVISSVSNLNRWSRSLGLFCHVPVKRDPWDSDWRLRMDDTPNAIVCAHIPVNNHLFPSLWRRPVFLFCLPLSVQGGEDPSCLILIVHFLQKSPINTGSFAKKWPAT